MTKKQKKVLYRIILSALLLAVLSFVPVEGPLRAALYLKKTQWQTLQVKEYGWPAALPG